MPHLRRSFPCIPANPALTRAGLEHVGPAGLHGLAHVARASTSAIRDRRKMMQKDFLIFGGSPAQNMVLGWTADSCAGAATLGEVLQYGVISDTHGLIPSRVFDVFDGARRIYHCGDVGSAECIAELEAIAPLRLVSGNMDTWEIVSRYPEKVVEEAEFGTLAMAHGSYYGHRNDAIVRGLLHQFGAAKPRLILFGHSHVPYLGNHGNGALILNPGSASRPRVGSSATVAIVEYVPDTNTLTARHVPLAQSRTGSM